MLCSVRIPSSEFKKFKPILKKTPKFNIEGVR